MVGFEANTIVLLNQFNFQLDNYKPNLFT